MKTNPYTHFILILTTFCIIAGCEQATKDHLWRFDTTGAVSSSPAALDGFVYFGSSDYSVYCLDALTGDAHWQMPTQGPVLSSPALANGYVYIGSSDGFLYCFNAQSGSQLWKSNVGAPIITSPAVTEGFVYITQDEYRIYCFDARTGAEAWQTLTFGMRQSTPALADGYLFTGSYHLPVYSLNAETRHYNWGFGADIGWDLKPPEDYISSSPALSESSVFVGSKDKNIYCINSQTGSKLWEFTADDRITSSPAVSSGSVWVGSDDKHVYCLDALTGRELWKVRTGGSVHSSPAVTDGYVYVGSSDGELYCIDAESGTILWTFASGTAIKSSPAVSGGKIYFGNEAGSLYCLTAAAGDNGTWPMFGFNAARIGSSDIPQIETDILALDLLEGRVEAPSTLYLVFSAETFDGQPKTDLTADDFEIFENDTLISKYESSQTIVPQPSFFAMRTVLLIDMSGSILESDTLDAIKTSARYFITSITAEGGTEIAIYLFDGRETITEQVAFTADNSTLLSALDTLTRETILSDPAYDISTNLNGAVQQGLKALDSACAATASSQICMGSLVTFTDGTDQAARIADSAAVESVTAADHASLTLGLGGEIDEAHLLALGKDGFAWAESSGDLEAAFKKVANDIRNKHQKYYILGYCSPKRKGEHEMTLKLKDYSGSLSFSFSADEFSGGCNPLDIIEP